MPKPLSDADQQRGHERAGNARCAAHGHDDQKVDHEFEGKGRIESEDLGTERAGRYMRKFYPWYIEPLGASPELAEELQRRADLPRARRLISDLAAPVPSL